MKLLREFDLELKYAGKGSSPNLSSNINPLTPGVH